MTDKERIEQLTKENKKLLRAYTKAIATLKDIEHNSRGLESVIAKSALAWIKTIIADDTPSATEP